MTNQEAIRALRDCGVIRARKGTTLGQLCMGPTPRVYSTPVPYRPEYRDYRLTERGKA